MVHCAWDFYNTYHRAYSWSLNLLPLYYEVHADIFISRSIYSIHAFCVFLVLRTAVLCFSMFMLMTSFLSFWWLISRPPLLWPAWFFLLTPIPSAFPSPRAPAVHVAQLTLIPSATPTQKFPVIMFFSRGLSEYTDRKHWVNLHIILLRTTGLLHGVAYSNILLYTIFTFWKLLSPLMKIVESLKGIVHHW